MLDTVKIKTMEFKVQRNNKFRTKLVLDHEGEMKFQRQYYNGNNIFIDIMGGVLFLHTSVPNLLYGSSLTEYDPIHAEVVKNHLNRELVAAGVCVDQRLENFSLSRVDTSRNIVVAQNIHHYLNLLSSCSYPRRTRILYNSDTVVFRNSQQGLLIYNKIREMKDKHKGFLNHDNRKENILRFESQMMNRRVIDRELRPNLSFPELLVETDILKEKLIRDFDELVGAPAKPNQVYFHQSDQLMELIKENKKRGVFSEFLSIKGLGWFLEDFNFDYHEIRDFLLRHFSKAQTFRILTQIKEKQQLRLEEKHVDLIEEMRVKLTA